MPGGTPPLFPHIPWFSRGPLLARSRQIIAVLTRHGLGWLLARMEERGSSPSKPGTLGIFRHPTPRQAREFSAALVELGPTFIKVGQAL
ncbi:MAG: hypothetical protein IH586_10065, partial [Anaerolineaceae bacterium]|nr:hypothetical protein [Anaerolineaceae bacterium]